MCALEADAYWIAGPLDWLRHAVTPKPGALPQGEWVYALCGLWTSIPLATPYGGEPRSKQVRAYCAICSESVTKQELSARDWDC